MPARCRLLASKEDPVPSGRVLSEKRPLPVFDTSRSHQLTWMSGFGGTPSPFARDIKQSNVPGSQASGAPRQYEKLAPSTKNGEGREFPLTPQLREVLATQLDRTRAWEREHGRIVQWLFHHDGPSLGHPGLGIILPAFSFRDRIQSLCQIIVR